MSDSAVTPPAAATRFTQDVAALTGKSATVRGAHSVIWVRGSDAVSFLDALLSQSVAAIAPGEVRRSFLLTPQGKMRALLWVLGSEDGTTGLVTQAATEAIVVEDLTRFRFRVDASIEVDARPAATLIGAAADEALLAADIPRPGSGWLPTPAGLIAAVPFIKSDLPRFVVVGDAAAAVGSSAAAASDDAYESVRIGMGEPVGTVDFDDSTISHELGPVDVAVDFTKGCYLGQELVARIDSRGRVNRILRGVSVARAVSLVGARLTTPEREVGTVTSAAPAPTGPGTIGLAMVRHEVENGSEVTATINGEAITATVEALPFSLDS